MTELRVIRQQDSSIRDEGLPQPWSRIVYNGPAESLLQDGVSRGTPILTQRGFVPVETLRPGDQIAALRSFGLVTVARAGVYAAELTAVRIRADALGAGRPEVDLVVGADQRIVLRDENDAPVVLPASALVNNATIIAEPLAYREFWFVELPQEGAPPTAAPSRRSDAVLASGVALMTRGGVVVADANAQMTVSARRLVLRQAATLGWTYSTDPAIMIEAAGQLIKPKSRSGNVFTFELPGDADGIRLKSRSGRPIEIDAASSDRRRLGIAVARLGFNGENVSLSDERLESGFYGLESDSKTAWRWTDGNALIRLTGPGLLDVTVQFEARCWKPRDARILAVRHASKAPDHYNPFMRWLDTNFPSVRSRFDLDFLPTSRRVSDYALVVPWLQDPVQHWSTLAYHHASELAEACRHAGVPLINDPGELVNAAKSTAAARFATINIRCPRARTLLSSSLAEAAEVIPLPILIREDWGHGSPSCVVRSLDKLASHVVEQFTRPAAIEFIDTAGSDGIYRKYRYLAAGDCGISVHLVGSLEWEVRMANRVTSEALLAEDKAYIAAPDPNHATFQAARRVLGLDFVAIDYSYDRAGKLIVWEANPFPAMNFGTDQGDLAYRDIAVHRFFAAMAAFYLERAHIPVPHALDVLRRYGDPEFETVVGGLKRLPP